MFRVQAWQILVVVLGASACRGSGPRSDQPDGAAAEDAGVGSRATGAGATAKEVSGLEAVLRKDVDQMHELDLKRLQQAGQLEELFEMNEKLSQLSAEERARVRLSIEKALDRTGRVVDEDTRQPYRPTEHGKLEPIARATGFIGQDACTATYLGDRIAITAGHCHRIVAFPRLTDHACDFEIEWRRTAQGAASRSRCERILAAEFDNEASGFGVDYMIFRIATVGGGVPTPLPQTWCSASPAPGQRLAVLSYPDGAPLTTSGDCSIQPTPAGLRLKPGVIAHDCDTESGSSGAGLVDATSHCLVAVHDGGKKIGTNADGGVRYMNFATVLSATPLDTWLPKGEEQ